MAPVRSSEKPSVILYEDKDIIVCKKPAGVPTQSAGLGTKDMVSILKNHLRASTPKGKMPYLAVIHRLDQPVEGLLVFAKTPAAARQLNSQLTDSRFGKHYLALLSQTPPREDDTLEDHLVKEKTTNTSRICSPQTPGAKIARLHYKVLKRSDSMTAVEILLDTGRHHQIRVQMSHLGCPIVGDRKYNRAANDSVSHDKLQLFAWRLSFCHPTTKKRMEFSYVPELPPEITLQNINI